MGNLSATAGSGVDYTAFPVKSMSDFRKQIMANKKANQMPLVPTGTLKMKSETSSQRVNETKFEMTHDPM
jgi:hypothetical protein